MKNPLNRRVCNIDATGIVNKSLLIDPAVESPGFGHMKIMIHNIHLNVNGVAQVRIYLGNTLIQEINAGAAGDFNVHVADVSADGNLSISINSYMVRVRGQIYYSFV